VVEPQNKRGKRIGAHGTWEMERKEKNGRISTKPEA
jgi:hypothetical protein